MSEVYQLNDLETNILFDMIENEKSKFYGTKSIINLSSNFSARAEVIKSLSDYSGGVFIHMDSSTGFWNHGHAAIGYKAGTVEIRGPKYKVSSYGESRLIEWYNAKTGGFYTVKGANTAKNNSAAAKAYTFIGKKYITEDSISGFTCVTVVTRAWAQGGNIKLNASTPSQLASLSKLVRQFKWADVKYRSF